MRLKRFRVLNYKIIDDTGWVDVDNDVTTLVGKNESGKTAVLKALWKSRNRAGVEFDRLDDYPRPRYNKDRKNSQYVVHTEYLVTDAESKALIATVKGASGVVTVVGQNTWYRREDAIERAFSVPELEKHRQKGEAIIPMLDQLASVPDPTSAIKAAASACEVAAVREEDLWSKANVAALQALHAAVAAAAPDARNLVDEKAKIQALLDSATAGDPLKAAFKWIEDHMPVFIYFDDYGQLETKIFLPGYIQKLQSQPTVKTRTQRALFSQSGLDAQEILTLGAVRAAGEADDVVNRRKDKRRALLQSASFGLTGDWVDWWHEKRHRLHFDADGDDLVLQVSDESREFPIPFEERSQGFQWFFSFYLVFLVESENAHRDSILLLDEPGLHLHPTLQQRLVSFFERVAKKNQLLYSTHLPFLIDGDHLERVRTVYLDKDKSNTVVSSDIRAGADYDTLFPLQAALGYSIAQTLFTGKKCVIVEGITDYWILKTLSDLMPIGGSGVGLGSDIVLVPAGGTSRMMPLASLMYGAGGVSGKNLLVLLDSDKEGANAKNRLDADLFVDGSRVLSLGALIGQAKATIEDVVPRSMYVDALRSAGYSVSLDAAEEASGSTAEALTSAFSRLGLGAFDHIAKTRAALALVDLWCKDRSKVDAGTQAKAAAVFKALNAGF